MSAAAAAAARSFLRSGSAASSLRSAAARAASRSGTAAPSRRLLASPPRVRLSLRSPLEMSSACLESLMPMHSATASAVMTSLLAAPARVGSCWLSEDH